MKWYLTFIFFLGQVTGYAQTHEIVDQLAIEAKLATEEQDFEKAAELLEKAAIAEKAVSNPRQEILYHLLRLSSHYFGQIENYEKAITLRKETIAICEILYGVEHENCGFGMSWLATYYEKTNQTDKATTHFLKALENTEKTLGKQHAQYGSYLDKLAGLYENMKQYDKALPFYLEALENTKNVLGKQHPSYGVGLNSIAGIYTSMGQYDKALPLYEEALEVTEKVLGKQHSNYVTYLNNLAGLYRIMKEYDSALSLYEEALETTEKTLGKQHPDYGVYLNNIARLYESMWQYDKAFQRYIEALENTETALGKQHVNYGTYLSNLVNLYKSTGQYDKALSLYVEALEGTEKALGKQHVNYGINLKNLAELYNSMGQYDMALPLYLEALENTEKNLGKQHSDYGVSLNSIAGIYKSMGQYDKALPLFFEALENAEKTTGKQHINYLAFLGSLASLYKAMGQYDKALPLYLNTLENTVTVLGKQHPEYGVHSHNLSDFYRVMGQYNKALPLSLEALENTEKNLGKDHPDYGNCLSSLGQLYTEMGQYDKALSVYLESLENGKKSPGKKHPVYGSRLNNLATLYLVMDRYDKALPLFQEALENTEEALGKEHPHYGIQLNNLARLYTIMGQYDNALPLSRLALENTEKALGRQHPHYTIRLGNIGSLYKNMGQYSKAFPIYLESLENQIYQTHLAFAILIEQEKENYIKTIAHYFDIYQSFFTNYSTQNYKVAESSFEIELLTKGMILNSSQQIRRAIEESEDTEALRIYEEWFAKKSALAQQYTLPISKRSGELKNWETEAEELEKQLIQLSATFKENTELGKITWQDIQTALQENQVAIEFASFRYENDKKWTDSTLYTALILKKGFERPVLVPLFEQRQLDSLLVSGGSDAAPVAGLYRGSEARSTNKNKKKLYDLIWKPLEAYLNENETVYFAPSGSLHQIAFSAIVTPNGKYLSDKYTLHQVSTTAKLLQTPKGGDLSYVTLFGGIDYTTPQQDLLVQAQQLKNDAVVSRSLTTDLQRGTSSWDYLPGTLNEVNAIREIAEKAGVSIKYFTAKTALEERFKQQSGKASPAILHVATHGFFFPDPEKQYKDHQLIMESEKNVYKLSDNPLNRSGLLFSGANTAWKGEQVAEGLEDGILTAYEASNMSLTNTRLVVLSACETGLGDIKGSEGVFGLQRAFKLAGAEYLLMSLWKVPDAETAEFMEKFYQRLFASKDIERSYRETQQFMKEKYPKEPYKWGAFVLMR